MKCWIHSLLVMLPWTVAAQNPVPELTWWGATVDSATQQITLRWSPSSDSAAMGYHICTGTPCLDYDTVFGRWDTSYTCADHSALEEHTYRLHVFDSAMNVSALTPAFGPMVLRADVPECETTVSTAWSPYAGMPSARIHYTLQVRLEPFYDAFSDVYTTTDSGRLSYTFDMSEAVTRAWLRVEARDEGGFRSLSNMVMVERRTVDSAEVVEIAEVEYDSIETDVWLTLETDTDFDYTLYRSIDGSPWREVATLAGGTQRYVDHDINPYDSLHCYQLGVKDACGLNEHYSTTSCVVVPDPPAPAAWFANVIVAGDERNGTFRPVMRGLKGNLYELSVYNRVGMLVYHTTDQEAGWTPAAQTPQGVYTYRLRCRFNTEAIKTYTGTLLLIK